MVGSGGFPVVKSLDELYRRADYLERAGVKVNWWPVTSVVVTQMSRYAAIMRDPPRFAGIPTFRGVPCVRMDVGPYGY